MMAVALIAAMTAGAAPAASSFAGHWTEVASTARCFAVRGFLLKPDGAARIDWADMNRVPPVVEHYDGRWTSEGDLLHLSMTLHLSISVPASNMTDVSSMEVHLDGPLDGTGKRLELAITTDGMPSDVRCAYVRDE